MADSSGSITGIQAWHDLGGTTHGDTYTLNTETVLVSTGVSLTKGVTIQGAGIGNSIYYDSVSDGAIFTLDHTSLASGQVIKLFDVEFRGVSLVEHSSTVYWCEQDHTSSPTDEPGTGGGAAYWEAATGSLANLDGEGLPAWSSASVEYKTGRGSDVDDGTVVLNGVNTSEGRVVVGNCKFDKLISRENIRCDGALGVVFGCTSILSPKSYYFAYSFHKNWGGSGSFGDGSWASPVNWGTDEFLYYEDNTISRAYDQGGAAFDSQGGARFAVRYNTIDDCNITLHGTESGGRPRGARAVEIYGNTIDISIDQTMLNIRSGAATVYDNTFTRGSGSQPLIRPDIHRCTNVFNRVGGADGRAIFDDSHASNPFVTGTATGGTTTTLTDSGKSWTTDEWVGYTIRSIVASGTATSGTVDGQLFDSSASWADDEWNAYQIWNKTQNIWGRVNDTIATGGELDVEKIGVAGANMEFDVGDDYEISFHSVIISNTATQLTAENVTSHTTPWDGTIANGKAYEINLIELAMDSPGAGAGYDYANANNFAMQPAAQAIDGIYEWDNTLNGGDGDLDPDDRPGLVEGTTFFSDTQRPSYTAYAYPHPLREEAGDAYSGPIRINSSGAIAKKLDGTGSSSLQLA